MSHRIVPRFLSKIRFTQFGHYVHGFLILLHSYRNCLAISRFSDSLWDLETKSRDCELITQTVCLTVKPWELAGLQFEKLVSAHPLHHDLIQALSVTDKRGQWCSSKQLSLMLQFLIAENRNFLPKYFSNKTDECSDEEVTTFSLHFSFCPLSSYIPPPPPPQSPFFPLPPQD